MKKEYIEYQTACNIANEIFQYYHFLEVSKTIEYTSAKKVATHIMQLLNEQCSDYLNKYMEG